MSNKPLSGPPLYQQKGSLVARAIEEFNKVSSKQENTETTEQETPVRKGANPQKRRSVLGRGLSSLMSPTAAPVIDIKLSGDSQEEKINNNPFTQSTKTISKVEEAHNATPLSEGFMMIAIDQLSPNPDQPRREFSQKEIKELASSIRRSGLIQPILIRNSKKKSISSALQEYQIVAGERRWRAAKEAGLIKIPAILKELSDRDTLELGIIENVQRQDLNPIEEALAYQKLISDFGTAQEELAQIIGKDRSSISNTMRLLGLPQVVQNLLRERRLSAGHGRALLSLEDQNEQVKLAEQLIEGKFSVRETEKLVTEKKKSAKNTSLETSTESILDTSLEDRLRKALGTKVKVKMNRDGKGEVRISFFSKAEFESFLDKVDPL
jgi:ParB family transcriptional regulator, chromosome partitioning protein